MPIWLSTSRFAPSPDILRTRQSIPEPSNEILQAFGIFRRPVPRFSPRPGMLLSREILFLRAAFAQSSRLATVVLLSKVFVPCSIFGRWTVRASSKETAPARQGLPEPLVFFRGLSRGSHTGPRKPGIDSYPAGSFPKPACARSPHRGVPMLTPRASMTLGSPPICPGFAGFMGAAGF